MRKILISCFVVICLSNLPVTAQDNSTPAYAGGFFQNFGIAIKANTTLGAGIDFMTALHPNIKLRLGGNYAGFLKFNIDSEFEGTSIDGLEREIPVHIDKISTDFLNGNLLIDLFPWKKAGFHFTVGTYMGKIDIPANGSAPEPFDVEGYIIRPETNGNFKATLRLGNTVKPYFGLGFGRTIPKHCVGFKFDLGMLYQGPFKIVSDNMNANEINNEINKQLKDLDIPKILTEIWPVMSFSLIYRIK